MARGTVTMNGAVVQQYLDGDHGVEALLEEKAQAAANKAESGAPVASGAYRASIHVETDHTDRMVKRVVADVPYAFVVEANTGNLARSL
jgi:hypothetical protein